MREIKTIRSLAGAITVVLILTGCAQSVPQSASAPSEQASTEPKEEMMTAVQFEDLVLELSRLDEENRAKRLTEAGLSNTDFRKRALELYTETMPSIEWLTKELSGETTESAVAKLASFGLFADFRVGVPASSSDLVGLPYALDAVELRAGEVVTVLVLGEYVESASKPAPAQSAKPSQTVTEFTVEYFIRKPLRYMDEVRDQEVYWSPKSTRDGNSVAFWVDIVTSPPTQAKCSVRNAKGDIIGEVVRSDSTGKAATVGYLIFESVLNTGEVRGTNIHTSLFVRCVRGESFSDSWKFTVYSD